MSKAIDTVLHVAKVARWLPRHEAIVGLKQLKRSMARAEQGAWATNGCRGEEKGREGKARRYGKWIIHEQQKRLTKRKP